MWLTFTIVFRGISGKKNNFVEVTFEFCADIRKTTLALKRFTIFLLVFTLAAGCADDEGSEQPADAAYFPLEKGLNHIYGVVETRYRGGQEPQTLRYELMTEVVDSFPSPMSQYTYVIHRHKRIAEGEAWEPWDTWSVRKDGREVIVTEGNTAFVKARFPVSAENRWNGNARNPLGEDEYGFVEIHLPREINGIAFEKTLTVEQERNEDRIVFRDERHEIYALGVGLIYREIVQLKYCTDDPCLGQQVIDEGIEMKMTIKEYGKHE